MEYDLEIVVPVSSKYIQRLEDFKKYGLINIGEKRVLVNLVLSAEKIDGIETGWPENVDAKSFTYKKNDYASNIYKHFLEMEPKARWIMKIDDDSCTDVSGLLKNIETYYDPKERCYLAASCSRFENVAVGGREFELRELYEEFFGPNFLMFQHEIECCVISGAGLRHIVSDERARKFLEKRIDLFGGATDVGLPFAALLAKMPPVDLPFATHFPSMEQFSLFGGRLNHIHMVSRQRSGDNFGEWERCGEIQFLALVMAIEGKFTETEKKIIGKKFLLETQNELRVYQVNENRTIKVKFDPRNYIWAEINGKIWSFCEPGAIHGVYSLEENGNLTGEENGQKVTLRLLD
jgi:hypothetical protein